MKWICQRSLKITFGALLITFLGTSRGAYSFYKSIDLQKLTMTRWGGKNKLKSLGGLIGLPLPIDFPVVGGKFCDISFRKWKRDFVQRNYMDFIARVGDKGQEVYLDLRLVGPNQIKSPNFEEKKGKLRGYRIKVSSMNPYSKKSQAYLMELYVKRDEPNSLFAYRLFKAGSVTGTPKPIINCLALKKINFN